MPYGKIWLEKEKLFIVEGEWRHQDQVFVGIGNRKLGENIITLTLPPDRVIFPDVDRTVVVCPGATPWCRRFCYAKARSSQIMIPKNLVFYTSNLVMYLEDPERFRESLLEKIILASTRVKPIENKFVVRLFVAGDFPNIKFIELIRSVADSLPKEKWQVYGYTRTWRIPEFLPHLNKLRELPHVVIYASTDPDSGPPPEGWLEAAVVDFTYDPEWRPYRRTIRCLEETHGFTCERCRICIFGRSSVHWEIIRGVPMPRKIRGR